LDALAVSFQPTLPGTRRMEYETSTCTSLQPALHLPSLLTTHQFAPLRLRRRLLFASPVARACAFAPSTLRHISYDTVTAERRTRNDQGVDRLFASLNQQSGGKARHNAAKHASEPPSMTRNARRMTERQQDRTKAAQTQAKKGADQRTTRLRAGQTEGRTHTLSTATWKGIKEQFALPSRKELKEELPNAPDHLLKFLDEPGSYKEEWFRQSFKNRLVLQFGNKSTPSSRSREQYKIALSAVACNGDKIKVEGYGNALVDAKKSASLYLVGRMYESGLLREFFGRPTVPFVNTDPPNADAKIAVFNNAARSLLVPRYTSTSSVSRETLHKVRLQGNLNPKYECTITLSELELEVVGAGKTFTQAEDAASTRFLEKLEEKIPETPPLSSLQSSHMEAFLNFWDHSKSVLTVSMQEDTAGKDRKRYRAQAMLAGQPVGEAVTMSKRGDAESLATLTAAVAFAKSQPQLLSDFEAALRAGGGKVLRAVRPVQVDLSKGALHTMSMAYRFLKEEGALKPVATPAVESSTDQPVRSRRVRNPTDPERRNESLQQAFKRYQTSDSTATMRGKREELPINQHRAEILKLVSDNPYTVVVGATGSGKTTQVPQMFLDEASEAGRGAACNVICTQPRRIAATSVARRVADERGEKLQESVGYIVRHNSAPPKEDGSVLFCTTGILLQQLQTDPDQVFDTTSHILLDEVHERDILLDFLLVILKKALKERKAANKFVPKVVLMSATMNTQLFSEYFGITDADGNVVPCPSIDVPGRLFPVKNRYLKEIHQELTSTYGANQLRDVFNEKDTAKYLTNELQVQRRSNMPMDNFRKPDEDGFDPDDSLIPVGLVAATVAHIAKTTNEGAILAFLPGQSEITNTKNLLTRRPVLGVNFNDTSRYKVFILHSTTPAEEQASVFEPVPEGCRKIILSTNIAETSVTIPDVQHVVDSGKQREKRYDPVNRISALKSSWVSKANAKQRAGRAGRVQNGNYYGLYTEERFESLKITGKAEMLRSDLQEICLDVKTYGFPDTISDFLAQALEPPNPKNVKTAVSTLQSIEALTENEDLTPLGELLATLPVEPAMGKMIVLGIIFRCLDPILILSSLSGSRNLLLKPAGVRAQWERCHKSLLGESQSEHIAQISAYKAMRQCAVEQGHQAAYEFGSRQFISMSAYEQTRRAAEDIEQILVQNQLIPYTPPGRRFQYQFGDEALNANSRNVPLIKALALVGFAPNLALNTGGRWFRTWHADDVAVHPKSALADRAGFNYGGAMMTYSTLSAQDDDSLFMRDITEISSATALLFGGALKMKPQGNRKLLVLDNWLPFQVGFWPEEAAVMHQFRQGLDIVSD
jgi:ATP-dependent RNA helicase DHX36